MNDEKSSIARNGVFAKEAGVVKLDPKTNRLERNVLKSRASPPLIEVSPSHKYSGRRLTYLDAVKGIGVMPFDTT
jgi:hypothetical protein